METPRPRRRRPRTANAGPRATVLARAPAVAALAMGVAACGESSGEAGGADAPYRIGARIEVGAAPHGIRFSPDGDTAWVALSGEGRIAVVDLSESAVVARWEAGDTPLDLVRVDGGWLVSQFRDSTLIRLDDEGQTVPDAVWGVGAGPSLFTPGTVRGETWITTEFSDRLWTVDTRRGAPRAFHTTGDRPYPADVMWDGSYAFVPNLDAGTVSVIDLLNGELDATVEGCPGPPGGALTPDQVTYVVACGGSDEVAFINTASFAITGRVSEGLGPRPFSVVVPGDGRYALVNNAGGNTVSVVDLESRTVVQRLEVGDQPIVLRAHPDGERVFVANELSGTLVELAPAPAAPESPAPSEAETTLNEVVVLGMIHSGHETSEMFSLEVVRDLVREIDPDYWLTEIPPNRWDRARAEFEATGTVEEPRVRRFPEYMEGLFPLSRELDFEVIPTAGWTEPMSDFRAGYLDAYSRDPARAEGWAEYRAAAEASADALAAGAADDPRWIHTDAYDEAYDIRMRTYARLFDAQLGPGGWEAINASHWAYIEDGLDRHRGEGVRFLLTYGAGHKGPFLRELRKRDDIVLLDVGPFLDRVPALAAVAPPRQRAPRRPSTDPVFNSSEHRDLSERLVSVSGGFFTPDGGLVVADRTEIHIIDMASGEHRVVGREGGGPKEFGHISRAIRTSEGVAVWDFLRRRVVSISHGGEFGQSRSYLDVVFNSFHSLRPVAHHPDGSTVFRDGDGSDGVRDSEGRYWQRARYVAVNADGGLRVVAETQGNERYSDTRLDRPVLFAHRTLEAATADRLVVAETDQGSISVLDWSGVPVAGIPMPTGVRLSADQVRMERESEASQRQGQRGWLMEAASDGRFPFAPSDVEERLLSFMPDWPANEVAPPIDAMLTDFDSRLWVRDYRLPGQDSVTWRVWDIDRERLLFTVSMDGEDRLLDARGDVVLLRRLDAFDAHRVVVTPLRPEQAQEGT